MFGFDPFSMLFEQMFQGLAMQPELFAGMMAGTGMPPPEPGQMFGGAPLGAYAANTGFQQGAFPQTPQVDPNQVIAQAQGPGTMEGFLPQQEALATARGQVQPQAQAQPQAQTQAQPQVQNQGIPVQMTPQGAQGGAPQAQPQPQATPKHPDISKTLLGGKAPAANGWAAKDPRWQKLSPYEKASAMSLMEADGMDKGAAQNALSAMINRSNARGENLGAHVSGKIYQPTREPTQLARLDRILKDPKHAELTQWAERRAKGLEDDPTGGATHFLAHEKVMEKLQAGNPSKYKSWTGWSGYNKNGGKYANPDGSPVFRDKSHAFLKLEKPLSQDTVNAVAGTTPKQMQPQAQPQVQPQQDPVTAQAQPMQIAQAQPQPMRAGLFDLFMPQNPIGGGKSLGELIEGLPPSDWKPPVTAGAEQADISGDMGGGSPPTPTDVATATPKPGLGAADPRANPATGAAADPNAQPGQQAGGQGYGRMSAVPPAMNPMVAAAKALTPGSSDQRPIMSGGITNAGKAPDMQKATKGVTSITSDIIMQLLGQRRQNPLIAPTLGSLLRG